MAGSPASSPVELLTEDNWPRLRHIRLAALKDDPPAFLSNHEAEAAYDDRKWRQEFVRGEWHIVTSGTHDVGLVGVTREPGMPAQECYLEYLWVARAFRRRGIGSLLLETVLGRLRESGVHTVWLWILDGNDSAMRLYQRFGFRSTNFRQRLPNDPARSEEKMLLRLH